MLRRILAAAILAGAVSGLLVSAFQWARIIPLIHEAEVYEEAAAGDATAHEHDMGWMPSEGAPRIGFTVLANVLAGVAFGLLLAACFALKGDVDLKQGIVWGLAGFAAFHLAPALGLPPEPPGAAAAPLHDRQMWWLMTAAATAGGLALLVFARSYVAKAAGIALIVLPHIVGAPVPVGASAVPADLASSFALASLATAAAFWAVLGGLSGFFFRAFAKET